MFFLLLLFLSLSLFFWPQHSGYNIPEWQLLDLTAGEQTGEGAHGLGLLGKEGGGRGGGGEEEEEEEEEDDEGSTLLLSPSPCVVCTYYTTTVVHRSMCARAVNSFSFSLTSSSGWR